MNGQTELVIPERPERDILLPGGLLLLCVFDRWSWRNRQQSAAHLGFDQAPGLYANHILQ